MTMTPVEVVTVAPLRVQPGLAQPSALARRLHDGIAQDLAFLGYEIDGLIGLLNRSAANAPELGLERARTIRRHLTAFLGDLRGTLGELRSATGPRRSLAAALTEQACAGTSPVTVHLNLSETSNRLASSVEQRLLEFTQHAISQARRRPGIDNLWVTLMVDAPDARLLIEHDGQADPGTTDETTSSTELIASLGGQLSVTARTSQGQRLAVVLPGPR